MTLNFLPSFETLWDLRCHSLSTPVSDGPRSLPRSPESNRRMVGTEVDQKPRHQRNSLPLCHFTVTRPCPLTGNIWQTSVSSQCLLLRNSSTLAGLQVRYGPGRSHLESVGARKPRVHYVPRRVPDDTSGYAPTYGRRCRLEAPDSRLRPPSSGQPIDSDRSPSAHVENTVTRPVKCLLGAESGPIAI